MKFENYPPKIILLSNIVSLVIYASGFFIIMKAGTFFALFYLAYILVLEVRLIKKHCVNCYYWGKICAFGKGRISGWVFKKGGLAKFCRPVISWKDMVPDMLISLIPFIFGMILLVISFKLSILIALFILVALTTMGNETIRGKYACKYCKQVELGCPAYNLFNKDK